jgi:predicted ATPase
MIRRLYVDNYRSLVDFTWEPGHETLVLGLNGAGKRLR